MLSSVPAPGAAPQTAKFYEGVFKVTQTGGTTQLALTQPLAPCRARGRAAGAAAKKKPRKRRLWGNGKGAFRTSGNTARPPCAARSGSCRTAAPAP